MTLSIPQHRDPVARGVLLAVLAALIWLAVTSALPQPSASAQVQPTVIVLIATPTLPAQQPAPEMAAATALPADPVVATAPGSQLVRHADGSTSLPGSEAWMAPQPDAHTADVDPQLELERAAAEAYRTLPTAAAPSAENQQPNRARRPYTGR